MNQKQAVRQEEGYRQDSQGKSCDLPGNNGTGPPGDPVRRITRNKRKRIAHGIGLSDNPPDYARSERPDQDDPRVRLPYGRCHGGCDIGVKESAPYDPEIGKCDPEIILYLPHRAGSGIHDKDTGLVFFRPGEYAYRRVKGGKIPHVAPRGKPNLPPA